MVSQDLSKKQEEWWITYGECIIHWEIHMIHMVQWELQDPKMEVRKRTNNFCWDIP